MSHEPTLREHLQNALDRHVAWVNGLGEGTCVWCRHEWPCLDAEHAVAALLALDEAERPNLQNLPLPGYCSCSALAAADALEPTRGADMTLTIRQRLEAILALHCVCEGCIEQRHEHAVAALKALDDAKCVMDYSDGEDLSELSGSERLVPDPDVRDA